MNVLILGSGGREHALAFKISKSPLCKKLFIAPGNAGTSSCGQNISIGFNDFEELGDFSITNRVGLIVVGPEEPLVNGIVDYFKGREELKEILILGPDKVGAQIEGSKSWAKSFMAEFGIPTAEYKEFSNQNREEGLAYLHSCSTPIVLKADGLAAGKGVIITSDRQEAIESFNSMLDGLFGSAGSKVVIEQFLEGHEFSMFALTDGKNHKLLPEAKDYKRVGEGDTGPNTGGMGAVSPVPFLTDELFEKVRVRIIEPTVAGLIKRQIDYRGFIFFGLINVGGDPYVIEYNCRMGDPETEVVIPRIENDILPFLIDAAKGHSSSDSIKTLANTATTIVLVSEGYPGNYAKGKVITGTENVKNSLIFHAGTIAENGETKTNGGRVLAITSFGKTIKEAVSKSMDSAELVNFEGKRYRTDIGNDLMKHPK